ncbi:uncharacterized protein LOC130449575 [Diorhabda sublineata]|uniref:uncharacterized protein LOC130449575 n=1 Tax=Diorhabda sublineata TaxID=1163346 RepID=UPI0024E15BC1|nr:uncharacterized protein LOC130449575 [Diorhabda sublineata]XP_056643480.1 uncharacterized protein LOC130449575 [Diorhabda sublineata]
MLSSTLNFINETEYESDPFAAVPNDVLNGTYPKTISIVSYYLITINILKLILVLTVIITNAFLAIVILRFEKLRSVRSNMYILNLSILNIIYYLCSPLFYIICHLFSAHEETSIVILQTQSTLLTLYTTFAFVMAIDWFFTGSKLRIMKTFDKCYKFAIIGIYGIFFIEWIIAFIYSEVEHIARVATFTIFYIIYAVVLTVLNILKTRIILRSESKEIEYSLTVSNIIIYSFLPLLCFNMLYKVSTPYVYSILLILELLPEVVEICHPILVVFMLGKLNKYFKMAYIKSFKRSLQNYQDEDLDTVSEELIIQSFIQVLNNVNQEEVIEI